MTGQSFRAGLITRWILTKGFRSAHSPFPGFAWRTDLVLEQPARKQRGVARIGRQFTAGADQQDVDRFAQIANSPSLSSTMVWIPARSAIRRSSHDLPPPELA